MPDECRRGASGLLTAQADARLGFAVELRSRYQLAESVFLDVADREGLCHFRSERLALAAFSCP
jgi:hypothetical protein